MRIAADRAIGAALLALAAALILTGCTDGGDAPTDWMSPPSVTTLGSLVAFDGPTQITYRWTGLSDRGKPGTVVWRIDGRLQRWDNVFDDGIGTLVGSFLLVSEPGGDPSFLGCRWNLVDSVAGQVETACRPNNIDGGLQAMQAIMGELWLFFRPATMTRDGERIVLDRAVPCYTGIPVEKLCVDEAGHVLYLVNRPGDDDVVFEATSITTDIEPFSWLDTVPAQPALTPLVPAVMSVDSLDIPSVILDEIRG